MKELLLVRGGTPATVDDELDPVVLGISGSLAQGTEESWIKLGHTRKLVIEDRRAVRDGTVSLPERTTVLTANTVLPAKAVEGWCGRRGPGRRRRRGREQLGAEGRRDRRDDSEQAGDADPANPDPTARCSCCFPVGHAAIEG